MEELSKAGGRRGAISRLDNGKLIVEVGGEPLYIVAEPLGDSIRLSLRVKGDLDERIDEALDEEVDPREVLEESLSLFLDIIDEFEKILSNRGFKVIRDTREAILDVYDALESRLEESG